MFAAKAIVEQKADDERTAPEDVSSKDFNESNGNSLIFCVYRYA